MTKQEFKPIKITLTEFNSELSRTGHHLGDTIKAQQEFINDKPTAKAWFGSKGVAGDCVAYIGNNCVKH